MHAGFIEQLHCNKHVNQEFCHIERKVYIYAWLSITTRPQRKVPCRERVLARLRLYQQLQSLPVLFAKNEAATAETFTFQLPNFDLLHELISDFSFITKPYAYQEYFASTIRLSKEEKTTSLSAMTKISSHCTRFRIISYFCNVVGKRPRPCLIEIKKRNALSYCLET